MLTMSISDFQTIYNFNEHPVVHNEVVLKLNFYLHPKKLKYTLKSFAYGLLLYVSVSI